MAPRLPRVLVAHHPHHIVQRGHSRQAVFEEESDRQAYLDDLHEKKNELGVQVHAYCLMSNHIHLLLTPAEDVGAVSRLMKEVARRATRRWNVRKQRSGSLWESRFKSSVVQSEAYLLACCRYIELNPVRAGMVVRAEDYRWSSYRGRMGIVTDLMLDLDEIYLALGDSDVHRRRAYQDYMESGPCEADLAKVRDSIRGSRPTARAEFVRALEESLQRKIEQQRRGRPSKI